jgi:hypothetical protein
MRDLPDPMGFPRIENQLDLGFFEFFKAHVELQGLGKRAAVVFQALDEQDRRPAIGQV